MKLSEIADMLDLTSLTPDLVAQSDQDITIGFVSDMMSDVLAHAKPGGVLITAQVHLNAIAVSTLTKQTAIIFIQGRTPHEQIRLKAIEQSIPLFVSDQSAFDLVGRLYRLGINNNEQQPATT